jgi:hypothetical protein
VTRDGDALLSETRRRKTAWLAARIGALEPAERERLAAALDAIDRICDDGAP